MSDNTPDEPGLRPGRGSLRTGGPGWFGAAAVVPVVVLSSLGFMAGSAESFAVAAARSFFFHSAASSATFILIPAGLYAVAGAALGAVLSAVVRLFARRRGSVVGHGTFRRARVVALLFVAAALCASLISWTSLAASTPPRTASMDWEPSVRNGRTLNIILITIDTLRADRLGCYGAASFSRSLDDISPVIDSLALEGTIFESAIVPMIATGPSHASILTSLYPAQHGIIRNAYRLSPSVPTLAERLRDGGYHTCAAVSVEHLDGYMSGLSRGFRDYIDRGVHDRFRHHFAWRAVPTRWIIEHERDAVATTDRVVSWVRSAARDPFFVWLHYFDPHMPYLSHDGSGPDFGWDDREQVQEAEGPELERLLRQGDARYGDEVAHVDAAIGVLIDELRDLGSIDNTLIVITSDHGEHLHEGRMPREQWYGHSAVYEEACRVPLIFWGPRVVPVGEVTEQVSVMDIAPTLLALAGAPELSLGGGHDLTRFLEGGSLPERPLAILPNPHGEAVELGLRMGDWKLFEAPGSEPILVNLEENPRELLTRSHVNSAQRDTMAALLARIVHDWGEDVATQELDEVTEEALRALGYVN